jgi:exodeoxyribonuclease V alpha subunit
MITQNDAALQLYNGDIGLCLKDAEQSGKLMVFFQRPDGSIKKCLPARLPHCETVYAMTIHKSQGSEFDEILIALPDQHNPVLTKELLYTAITRARKSVKILADQKVFNDTVLRKIERFGGLAQKLTCMADL